MPNRIQRKRTKGWRAPEGAIYVGRGSEWGNPWRVGEPLMTHTPYPDGITHYAREFVITPEIAVALYRSAFELDIPEAVRQFRGRDLMCWCPLDSPCHADVLLEWANA